jgi:hypothetical protein
MIAPRKEGGWTNKEAGLPWLPYPIGLAVKACARRDPARKRASRGPDELRRKTLLRCEAAHLSAACSGAKYFYRIISLYVAETFYFLVTNFTIRVTRQR